MGWGEGVEGVVVGGMLSFRQAVDVSMIPALFTEFRFSQMGAHVCARHLLAFHPHQ